MDRIDRLEEPPWGMGEWAGEYIGTTYRIDISAVCKSEAVRYLTFPSRGRDRYASRRYPGEMVFGPSALRGFSVGGAGGRVEYRLARNAVVKEFQKGRLSRLDVCDAHPELLRAARNVGVPLEEDCPICEEAAVVHVTYVFGPKLPAHGRCVSSPEELAKLCRRPDEVTCYVVEVCPVCAWNHLARMYPAGGRHRHAGNGRAQLRGAIGQHGPTGRSR